MFCIKKKGSASILNAISKNTKAIQEEKESKFFFEEINQEVVKQEKEAPVKEETKNDEWEISFEVRD